MLTTSGNPYWDSWIVVAIVVDWSHSRISGNVMAERS